MCYVTFCSSCATLPTLACRFAFDVDAAAAAAAGAAAAQPHRGGGGAAAAQPRRRRRGRGHSAATKIEKEWRKKLSERKMFFGRERVKNFTCHFFGEFWRSSQDSFVSGHGSDESWDVRQSSAKSGVSNFGKVVVFGNEKSSRVGTRNRRVWERGDVVIGTHEMS